MVVNCACKRRPGIFMDEQLAHASSYDYCIEHDSGWEDILMVLEEKRQSYLAEFGNKTQDWLKRAGLGAIGGATASALIAGPIGILAAVGAGYYADKEDEAIMEIAHKYDMLVDKTDEWLENNFYHSRNFYDSYIQSVCESIAEQSFSEGFNDIPKVLKKRNKKINEAFDS